MIDGLDEQLLRQAIAVAVKAVIVGDAPYGSLLATAEGQVLIEAHNTVRRDNDITSHPELKLARYAAAVLAPEVAARTTMYTSCEPCQMCTGAIVRSGLGRVVYALSTEQLIGINPQSAWRPVPLDGPALFDEAQVPVVEYYRPASAP
jgi:tRNA(Arg) A34 adenosine deaminase TadA